MTIYYLYVKTHNKTGLKYLGYTKQKNPHKYLGSGYRWNNHLRVHGNDIRTNILQICNSKKEIRIWGIYYSKLWNVVQSKEWANLKEEQGDGGGCFGEINGMFGKTHTQMVKEKLGILASQRFKGKTYKELYGEEKATELKNKRSLVLKGKNHKGTNNPRYDKIKYVFYNKETTEKYIGERQLFMQQYKINKTGVSDMINKGITYRNWCVSIF